MIFLKNKGIVPLFKVSLLCLGLLCMQISWAASGSFTGKKNQQLASGQKTAAYYCKKAESSDPPERQANLLLCANAFLKNHQVTQAQDVLSQIQGYSFEGNLLAFKKLVDARLALTTDDAPRALSLLKNISPQSMSLPVTIEYHDLLARTYEQTGDYLKSVTQRVELDSILSDKNMVELNNQLIWATIQNMNPRSLQAAAQSAQNYTLRGWLDLALIEKNMTTSELATWQSEYRGHPGEALLPHNMSPTTLSDFQANHIALLLPLTGTHAASAQAIREGFMASLAFEHNQGGVAPRITLIDTQDDHNIAQAYREAQEAGAQMIIGPLTKPGVEQISRLASRDLPILALNNIDQLTPSYLFQFGLAPEDEARQAADRAFQDGHLNALIIAQSGEWGERLTQAFTQRWESLGGTVVGITEYDLDQPLAGAVKSALKIDTSEARAQSLINTLNIPLEFDPRRRQDIDMVFIASQPVQARQIPPLLAFYFAHDLPIYATSSVYSSNSTSAENKDLNGLVFCDIPWNIIARPVTPESDNLIAALWPEPTQAQPRLYALGVDAYQLVQVLPRLQAIPHFSLNGATGKLSLDNNHRIVRNLRCTKFTNGEPKRLDPHA